MKKTILVVIMAMVVMMGMIGCTNNPTGPIDPTPTPTGATLTIDGNKTYIGDGQIGTIGGYLPNKIIIIPNTNLTIKTVKLTFDYYPSTNPAKEITLSINDSYPSVVKNILNNEVFFTFSDFTLNPGENFDNATKIEISCILTTPLTDLPIIKSIEIY